MIIHFIFIYRLSLEMCIRTILSGYGLASWPYPYKTSNTSTTCWMERLTMAATSPKLSLLSFPKIIYLVYYRVLILEKRKKKNLMDFCLWDLRISTYLCIFTFTFIEAKRCCRQLIEKLQKGLLGVSSAPGRVTWCPC